MKFQKASIQKTKHKKIKHDKKQSKYVFQLKAKNNPKLNLISKIKKYIKKKLFNEVTKTAIKKPKIEN